MDRKTSEKIRDWADQVREIGNEIETLCREFDLICGLERDQIERLEALKASRKKRTRGTWNDTR